NVLSRGDKILTLESGAFAAGWGEMGEIMGASVERLPGDWRRAVDPAEVEERLRADTAGEIKAVLTVQVDTASGVVNDIPAIRKAIDDAGHGALFMVDTIASLGTMAFEMDQWGVDVSVTGAQKGLMVPPGLSFVAAGPKAKAAHEHAGLRTHYWDWTFREGKVHYQKYCGTPPEHMLFALRKALDLLLEEGLGHAIERHRLLADATRAAVGAWAQGGVLEFNITDPEERSNSVTTIVTADGSDPQPIIEFCRETCGVVLGIGISALDGKAIRIAHMGHVNAPMVLGTLGATETTLKALGVPHGPGVQAAVQSLGSALKR
ncbi:MAG: pyridoxal-phosphate-dependent aminotransferase family protein, partial [Hyphomicrobiales bacterium]